MRVCRGPWVTIYRWQTQTCRLLPVVQPNQRTVSSHQTIQGIVVSHLNVHVLDLMVCPYSCPYLRLVCLCPFLSPFPFTGPLPSPWVQSHMSRCLASCSPARDVFTHSRLHKHCFFVTTSPTPIAVASKRSLLTSLRLKSKSLMHVAFTFRATLSNVVWHSFSNHW